MTNNFSNNYLISFRLIFLILIFFLCIIVLFSPYSVNASSFDIVNFNYNSIPLNQPVSCTLDSNRNLYICDADLKQITVLDKNGDYCFSIEKNISLPIDICVDSNNIFVLDGENHCVLIYDLSGKYKKTLGKHGLAPSQFNNPTDIYIDGNSLYVVDSGNNRIQVFDKSSLDLLRLFGIEGIYMDLDNPTAMYISDDDIFLVENGGSKVFSFNKISGQLTGTSLSLQSQRDVDILILNNKIILTKPADKSIDIYDLSLTFSTSIDLSSRGYKISSDIDKNLYICGSTIKTSASPIMVLDDNYNETAFIPDKSSSGLFDSPYNLTKDNSGNFYIADNGNKRIQVFDKDLKHLFNISRNIENPIDINFYNSQVFVLDTASASIDVFDKQGSYIKSIPLGIAVNPLKFDVIDEDNFAVVTSKNVFLVSTDPLKPSFQILIENLISEPIDVDYHQNILYILGNRRGDLFCIDLSDNTVFEIPISTTSPSISDASSVSVTDNSIFIGDNNSSKIYYYSISGGLMEVIDLTKYSMQYPFSLYSYDDKDLYICFKSTDIIGKLSFVKGSFLYYITVNGEKIDEFSPDVFSYDFNFSTNTENVYIDVVLSDGIKARGDTGKFLLNYGLNRFDISFNNGIEWHEYFVYIVKNMPEGLDLSLENINAYIDYKNNKEQKKTVKNSGSSKSSDITIAISFSNIDANAFKAISQSKHIKINLKDSIIYITFDKDDFEGALPEIFLVANEGMIAISEQEMRSMLNQKRNMFIITASLVGAAMMFVVYFFSIKYKHKPKKRDYKKI